MICAKSEWMRIFVFLTHVLIDIKLFYSDLFNNDNNMLIEKCTVWICYIVLH